MKVTLNGWWHPCTMHVSVKINNISEAEKLRDFLKSMGEHIEAKNVQKHINFQADMNITSHEVYSKGSLEYQSTEDEYVKEI